MRHAKEWAKGTTRAALLAVLEPEESYGYQIVSRLGEQGLRFLPSTEAAIYPVLRDLEAQGYLKAQWRATEPGVPARKYYSLTAKGAELLASLRKAWKEYRREMEHVLGVKT